MHDSKTEVGTMQSHTEFLRENISINTDLFTAHDVLQLHYFRSTPIYAVHEFSVIASLKAASDKTFIDTQQRRREFQLL